MNIFQALEEDHGRIKGLFQRIQQRRLTSTRTVDDPLVDELLADLSKSLTAHMEIEERLFYPALADVDETRVIVADSYREHGLGRDALNALTDLPQGSQRWAPTLNELQQLVDLHVQHEEEQLFPRARNVLSGAQAQEMGERFEEERRRQVTGL